MHKRLLAKLLLLAPLALLASCTSFLRNDVVSFHEGNLPQNGSIRIEASDPAKAQSLEFRAYARLIGAQLNKLGYSFVDDPAAATTLIAQVDYSVAAAGAQTRVDSPLQSSVYYHFQYGHFYDPFHFGIDDDFSRDVVTTTSYLRSLSMVIVKTAEPKTHLFEGHVQNHGQQNQLPDVMPYLITALFLNFPGESGVTKTVTIEMDKPRGK